MQQPSNIIFNSIQIYKIYQKMYYKFQFVSIFMICSLKI